MSSLDGKKTHLAVVGAIVMVIGSFVQGDITVQEMVNQILMYLPFSTIRMGIAKAANKNLL